jgi:GTPase KRas protein
MRTGQAFMLVYSITDANSFDYISDIRKQMLASEWFEEERRPIVVLGNKSDLQEMRKVSYEDGQKIAQTLENCEFLETSAKEGTNVDEAFKCIARRLLKKYRKEETIQKNGTSCVLS